MESISKYLFLLLFFCLSGKLKSQNLHFIHEGKIEFERKFNLHSLFSEEDSWTDEIKKNIPQFKVTYFDLYFANDKVLYKPGRENVENNKFGELPSEDNIIYTDLSLKMATSQKRVFEKTFLVLDSTRKIKWKITDEKRTIAGYECRRANAIIMDSIYVVAYYCDEILVQGGPESFSGLPGMILGVALPHEHITWFATNVTLLPIKESDLKIPIKGIKTNNKSMLESLRVSLKDWGKWGFRYIKSAML